MVLVIGCVFIVLTTTHLRAPAFQICKAPYQNHKLYTKHPRICKKKTLVEHFFGKNKQSLVVMMIIVHSALRKQSEVHYV